MPHAASFVKHRRLLEDLFFKNNLNIVNGVQLLFTKPEVGGRDNRALAQPCLALMHNNFDSPDWMKSDAVKEGKVGPVPLLKFGDFLGFDETTRPSASARVEQTLVSVKTKRFYFGNRKP